MLDLPKKMGIFEKIFGGSTKSKEEDKWAIFLNLAARISTTDGNLSQEEIFFSRDYLAKKAPQFSEKDWNRIFKRSDSLKNNVYLEADKLSESDKYELITYLIGLANSDGNFDSKEYAFIFCSSIFLKLDKDVIFKMLSEQDIDFEAATKEIQNMMNKLGI